MLFFELDENFTVRGTVFQRIVEKNVENLFEMCGTALYPHIICDLVVQCQTLFKIQRDMTLQAVVNTYGTALVVAYGVCLKVEGLGMQIGDALGTALGTFAGQNAGAKDIDRIKAGLRSTVGMCIIGYAVVSPFIYFAAPVIMRMFTDSETSIGYGVEYMRIFAPFLIGVGILTLFHNLLRAVGDVKITICMGISEVITRIGFAFLFSYLWGYHGLWFVSPLTWCCAAMVGAARYLSGTWKRKLDQMEMVQDI